MTEKETNWEGRFEKKFGGKLLVDERFDEAAEFVRKEIALAEERGANRAVAFIRKNVSLPRQYKHVHDVFEKALLPTNN